MDQTKLKALRRTRRKQGLRKRILGVPAQPRLTIFRSNKHVYAQLVDDLAGRTIASASSNEKGSTLASNNVASATEVGRRIAERAMAAGVERVVFDRNGFRYHGRVKALADAARKQGLKF